MSLWTGASSGNLLRNIDVARVRSRQLWSGPRLRRPWQAKEDREARPFGIYALSLVAMLILLKSPDDQAPVSPWALLTTASQARRAPQSLNRNC
jgi:hypothetical protein